jgi:hypothetical protein
MTLLFALLLASSIRLGFSMAYCIPTWLGWLGSILRRGIWSLMFSLALACLAHGSVSAGWLWDVPPDPKIEAANRALERAAELATEAARTQSGQHAQLLDAVEVLSTERTHLASYLQALSTLGHQDSAWAAAIHAAVPLIISAAVLVVSALAIWLIARESDDDAHLATVLVDEIAGTGPSLLELKSSTSALASSRRSHQAIIPRGMKTRPQSRTYNHNSQEMPF